jgi:hypothetical protein
MDEVLTVRFSERQEYDINRDAETVMFMATTGLGTYFGTAEYQPRKLNEFRKAFKEYVLQAMAIGTLPHEVDIG